MIKNMAIKIVAERADDAAMPSVKTVESFDDEIRKAVVMAEEAEAKTKTKKTTTMTRMMMMIKMKVIETMIQVMEIHMLNTTMTTKKNTPNLQANYYLSFVPR